jgi:type II secretory pathway pseudopilin PulG
MKKGFTYIEVVLYIAILSLVFALSMPFYQTLQNRNELDITANTLAQSYRRAELLSQASDGDSTWGVKMENGKITMFKGTSFATRDQNLDETFAVAPSITFTGTDEMVFAKVTGQPAAAGSLTLTSPNNETRTVTINSKGIVNY